VSQQVQLPHRPKPTTYDVPTIVEFGMSGRFRVPRFQRNYVWDTEDVLSLFDSIWRGFPIGTLLLWENFAPAQTISFGPLRLEATQRTEALWVVDGQQRITSLVGALNTRFRDVDDRFEVYFDLRRGKFVSAKSNKAQPTWLPVHVAVETRRMLSWLRERGEELTYDDLDIADAVAGALREYQVPAYIVGSEDDHLLRQVFDRVNSAGKPIGRTEIFHALFASDTDPGSPSTVVAGLKRLKFGEIDENKVVQTLLALRGGNIQRDLHDEFAATEDVSEWYEKTELALGMAIDFLKAEGVPHVQAMPSTLPIPVIATFFHLHPTPEPYIRRLLSRWLWRGWVHGFGQQGQTPALRQAAFVVNPRKNAPDQCPDEFTTVKGLLKLVSDDQPSEIVGSSFTTRNARGKLIMLAMAALKPRQPDGTAIDLSAAIERSGLDIFRSLFPQGKRNSVGNRGYWPVDGRKIAGDEAPKVLVSHAIDARLAKLLRVNDIEQFVSARERAIENYTREFVTGRVEPKAIIRRPLSSLLVPDED
jgi:hypothetical protein